MEFYKIELDRDATCSMIAQFSWDAYNWLELCGVGHRVRWPELIQLSVGFVVEDGYIERLVDYVDIPTLNFPAISARAKNVVLNHVPGAVQLLPIQLVHEKSGEALGTYWIMNVVRTVEGLDFDNTEWTLKQKDFSNPSVERYIRRATLIGKIVESHDLFQLVVNGRAHGLFCSAKLEDELVEANAADGFKFVPVRVV